MSRLTLSGIAMLFVVSVATPQDTTDKRELRYAFTKGEKLTLALTQKMGVKLDEVPEQLQGMAPEEPLDVGLEGEVTLEVITVDANGTATLEGKFQKITSKGSVMGQDYEYAYDRAKDKEPKDKDKEDDSEGDLPGMPNPEEMLSQLSKATLKLEITPLGKVKVSGGANTMGDQLLDLGGLAGQLPKEKVGPGDQWKNDDSLALPGLPVKILVQSRNTFEKVETVEGQECAVIQNKFTVGMEGGGAAEESDDQPIPFKASFTGEGTGGMRFSLTQGRPLKSETKLEAKVKFTIGNPEDGSGMELKGKFKLAQAFGLKKRE